MNSNFLSWILSFQAVRASGRGYQTLINETLRRALVTDDLKEAFREVIREELHPTWLDIFNQKSMGPG